MKKIKFYLSIIIFSLKILLLTSYDQIWAYRISVTPSSLNIPRGTSSTQILTYEFIFNSTEINYCGQEWKSNLGKFMMGSEILEKINVPLRVKIKPGRVTISENLLIPVRVLERVLAKNQTEFIYIREFSSNYCKETVITQIKITGEAEADFRIQRMELFFNNRQAKIIVPRNFKDLKAYAEIRFTGSGLFRGYWEVDGRILSYVQYYLVGPTIQVFVSPEIPSLPTFSTGVHIVRFVVENPKPGFELPSILYFVLPEETPKTLSIKLLSPSDNSSYFEIPQTFTWEPLSNSFIYLIQFYENPEGSPIFSAYTRNASYNIPEEIAYKYFKPGNRYFWRVDGFDKEGRLLGESAVWSFNLKEEQSFVPEEIIVVFEEEKFSPEKSRKLMERYHLEELRTYSLKTLPLHLIIFHTKEDVLSLVKLLSEEPDIFLSQPNFIFHTAMDPLVPYQTIYNVFDLKEIHQAYRGKGIKVAIIDTGIDVGHEDLKDRIKFFTNFINKEPYKSEIHGTAVAGILAASINNLGIIGVAPEAELFSLRACRAISPNSHIGECYSESIILALDEALHQKVKIINMSFGGSKKDPLISKIIDKGSSQGVIFVAPIKNKNTFPASHPSVIAVGGVDEHGNPFPSKEIISNAQILVPAVKLLTTFPNNHYNFLSGPSLASAAVSGFIALILEKNSILPSQFFVKTYPIDLCILEKEIFRVFNCSFHLLNNKKE